MSGPNNGDEEVQEKPVLDQTLESEESDLGNHADEEQGVDLGEVRDREMDPGNWFNSFF